MKNKQKLNEIVLLDEAHETGKDSPADVMNISSGVIITFVYFLLILTFPFSLFCCFKVIKEYERGIIFRLGRLKNLIPKGPGICFLLPRVDKLCKVDMRICVFDIPPQKVLSNDSISLSIDAVVYFRIFNPVASILNIENVLRSTESVSQTILKNVISTMSLDEILSNRENIASLIMGHFEKFVINWGVIIERIEVRDIRLPDSLQKALTTKAEAIREAQTKLILAESEEAAVMALTAASKIIKDSPTILQLRYLQTLDSMGNKNNSAILLPLDFMQSIKK